MAFPIVADFNKLQKGILRMGSFAKFKIEPLFGVVYWIFKDFQGSYRTIIIEGLKPVIFIGRLLGALPGIYNLGKDDDNEWKITPISVYSVVLAIFYLINAILQLTANVKRYHDTPLVQDKLQELILPGYAVNLFFIQIYFLLNAGKLKNLIRRLVTNCEQPLGGREKDTATVDDTFTSNYPKFCLIALLVIMIYGIIENVVYDIQNLTNADLNLANTTIQRYYVQALFHWTSYIPNNSCLTVLFVALIKCGTYSWIFGDILVIVLCRAVAERLKILHGQIEKSLDPSPSPTSSSSLTLISDQLPERDEKNYPAISWDEIRIQYMSLTELTLEMSRFISPIMFSCYSINMYLIVINLFSWIAPNASFTEEQTFYSYFAFAHFSFRVASVTYFVADVYHVGNSIVATIQKCPNSLFTLSVERLERSLIWNPCGITLFGTLIISRKFFISIISFIFTTEIVLLQTTKA